jgi:putative SOS response-associated peptidase YedK
MCGRYVRRSDKQRIAEHFRAHGVGLTEFGPSYNVAPQTFQPIVRLNRDSGQREIVLMRWGLVPYWSKDTKIALTTINARAETVADAAPFREAFRKRRCLVPADAFYEWQKLDAKTRQPLAIGMHDGSPYAFAGLWDRWKDPVSREPLETFTVITCDANELLKPMHDRMPVIVPPRDYERWLQPGDPERPPLDLLRPFPEEQMVAWKVDRKVGSVRNDTPDCVKPIANDAAAPPAANQETSDEDDKGATQTSFF